MANYNITWRPMAAEDLNTIIDYIANDNPLRADDFGDEIYEKTLALMANPLSGRTGRPGLPGFVRELVVHKNYIVFYRVITETQTVEILRVKHAAQKIS